MIELLVVEDSPRKVSRVIELAERVLLSEAVRVDTAASAYEAGIRLTERPYDLLVLDINLPIRPGETPEPKGGLSVLRALRKSRKYQLPAYIVGLSAYPELVAAHRDEFNTALWHLVEYQDDSSAWERPIELLLEHVTNRKVSVSEQPYDFDLAVITALHREWNSKAC